MNVKEVKKVERGGEKQGVQEMGEERARGERVGEWEKGKIGGN